MELLEFINSSQCQKIILTLIWSKWFFWVKNLNEIIFLKKIGLLSADFFGRICRGLYVIELGIRRSKINTHLDATKISF